MSGLYVYPQNRCKECGKLGDVSGAGYCSGCAGVEWEEVVLVSLKDVEHIIKARIRYRLGDQLICAGEEDHDGAVFYGQLQEELQWVLNQLKGDE